MLLPFQVFPDFSRPFDFIQKVMYNASEMKIFACALCSLCIFVFLFAHVCFSDTQSIEGLIVGTGPGKVWINLGSEHGVIDEMIFDVKRGEEVVGKIKIKKAGKSSSEAVPYEAKQGSTFSSGDSVKLSPETAPPEIKSQPAVKSETKTPLTAVTPATPLAENNMEQKKTETQPVKNETKTSPVNTEPKKEEVSPDKTEVVAEKPKEKPAEKSKSKTKTKEKEKDKKLHRKGKWGIKNKGARMIVSVVLGLLIFGRRF